MYIDNNTTNNDNNNTNNENTNNNNNFSSSSSSYYYYDSDSVPEFPHPPPLSRPRYGIFSGAVHVRQPYGGPQHMSYRGLCSGGGGGNFSSQ